jgi:arabinofuranosyltransferase
LCSRGPRRATFRLMLWLVLPPAICTLGQLAFRLFYYGDFWPNPYYAKGSFTWVRVEQGWNYIRHSHKPMGALWVGGALTLCLATFSQELRRRIWFAFFALILWLLYLVRIGGDIFPQRRHLLVVFGLLAFLLLALLQWLWERRHFLRFSAWLVGPLLLMWLGVAQKRDVARLLALADKGHWSGQPVGQFLRKAFGKQRPLLAVDAAGALPFFYQLPCLDMLGLNDRTIAHHPPPDIGTGFIGHELGDGRYVMSRKPDLVAFWTPIGGDRPRYRSGKEMVEQPAFYQIYQAITFETDDDSHKRTRLWLRRRDGRLGMQTHGDQFDVPGYLLQGGDNVVRLDADGRLYVSLKPNDSAAVRGLRLPPGRFTVRVSADGPTTVQVLAGGRTLVLDDKSTFRLEAGDTEPEGMDVRLTATAAIHVFGLVFARQSPDRSE